MTQPSRHRARSGGICRPGRSRERSAKGAVGLALAGGGPLSGIYKSGHWRPGRSVRRVDFTEIDIFVGVSSGGFIAAALANGMSPGKLARWSRTILRKSSIDTLLRAGDR